MCASLVLVATRDGLRLSPDSITYLSVADHLRHGRGLTDFTGDQLTVFGPVQPLLLAPGGRGIGWARVVSAVCVGAAAWLQYVLIRARAGFVAGVIGAVLLGACASFVLVAASGFSELPYIAASLAMFVVFRHGVSPGRCALAGALASIGFLARYAGASLVMAGAMVVALAVLRPERGGDRWRSVAAYTVGAGVPATAWIVHNLAVDGHPLGPRFEGGTSDSWGVLLRRPFRALGDVLIGEGHSADWATAIGVLALIALVVAGLVWEGNGTLDPVRAGLLVYAAANFALPVVARRLTANDISARVMSPMLIPLVYVVAVAAGAVIRSWPGRLLVASAVGLWAWQGVTMAADVPDYASSGDRSLYSAEMYDAVDALPADVQLLTNNPWGLWWQSRREPTLFAFTRPRPGNSHYPIGAERLLSLACERPTYLAWFSSLTNAGDGPEERRPDLLRVVRLDAEHEVAGGVLYRVQPHDEASCTG
ncbi:MAG: ArnT family glycosyltransferase [Ilumatobacteraceae bacterium]